MMKTLLSPLTRTACAVAAVALMFSPLASAKPDHDRDDRAVAHRTHPWDRPWIRDWIRDHDRDGGRDHDWNRDRDDRLSVHRPPYSCSEVIHQSGDGSPFS